MPKVGKEKYKYLSTVGQFHIPEARSGYFQIHEHGKGGPMVSRGGGTENSRYKLVGIIDGHTFERLGYFGKPRTDTRSILAIFRLVIVRDYGDLLRLKRHDVERRQTDAVVGVKILNKLRLHGVCLWRLNLTVLEAPLEVWCHSILGECTAKFYMWHAPCATPCLLYIGFWGHCEKTSSFLTVQ